MVWEAGDGDGDGSGSGLLGQLSCLWSIAARGESFHPDEPESGSGTDSADGLVRRNTACKCLLQWNALSLYSRWI